MSKHIDELAEQFLEEMAEEASLPASFAAELDLEMLALEVTQEKVKAKSKTKTKTVGKSAPLAQVVPPSPMEDEDFTRPGLTGHGVSGGMSDIYHMKIAQSKMDNLEKELLRLRKENETLSSGGRALKEKLQQTTAKNKQLSEEMKDYLESKEAELQIYKQGHQAKENEIAELKQTIQELETRLHHDIQRIRVREKELEHRLEIMSLEKSALLKNKDKVLLDLKMKQESLMQETSVYRSKLQKLNQEMGSQQDRFRKTALALRLALSNIEINEEIGSLLKKVE